MKGTLVKEYEDFYLISDKEIQKGDEYVKLNNRPRTLLLGTTISHVTKVSKLSLKNCEAIANGYDLDELALDYYKLVFGNTKSYKDGFQKALEILGDKKFSLDDMKEAMLNTIELTDWQKDQFRKDGNYHMAIDIIQSLQQTEWDVEVVMDRIPADLAPGGWDVFPKLDAENCLILKRVE